MAGACDAITLKSVFLLSDKTISATLFFSLFTFIVGRDIVCRISQSSYHIFFFHSCSLFASFFSFFFIWQFFFIWLNSSLFVLSTRFVQTQTNARAGNTTVTKFVGTVLETSHARVTLVTH